MTWDYALVLGVAVTIAALALGGRVRGVSADSLERRCRWLIRLALGFGAVLLLGALVPLGRFVWLLAHDAPPEALTAALGMSIAAAMNLVMGFLAFGTLPTLIAFRLSRLVQKEKEKGE